MLNQKPKKKNEKKETKLSDSERLSKEINKQQDLQLTGAFQQLTI
jgi:hypothetical protein